MKAYIHQLFLIFIALILLSCTAKEQKDQQEGISKPLPPNILFILTDDQGWGDLSINGNTNLSTPNIDKLANAGAMFDRFYVSPVCSPTRAEILTGRYHPRGGVYSTSRGGERLDLDETTLADVLKEAGYVTGAFGKWHNGMQPPYHPNARGFDEYYGFCSGHWGNYFSPMLEHNGTIIKGNGFVIDDFTTQAMKFMEVNDPKKTGRPFLAYLPFNTPHSPMQVPDKYWEKFENNDLGMRHRDPEKEKLTHSQAALAMVENIDWNVGRLVEKIESMGLTDNTIIVYLSDNGPNGWRWNGDMKGRKGSTDEGGVRSPLIVQWIGKIASGKNVPQIASAIDLMPTLMDLAGVERTMTKPLDGVSLKPLLEGKEENWPDRLVFNYWSKRTSVRSQQYRLDDKNQLFDMVKDPGQREDIAESVPEVAQQLIAAKDKWISEVLSELPESDERTFPIGHPNYAFTQVPIRDAQPHGHIKRSNRHPNDTYFTNWISTGDSITWDVEVLEAGDYDVTVYYTCKVGDEGAVFQLRFGDNKLNGKINEAHDPPLFGMEDDRDERIESYVKDFRPLKVGKIHLEKGKGRLLLKALEIPGNQVMDIRLLMFNRAVM
ncbi:MAG: arylsulfatase [Cyclobacteriaceae bacterium]|nr:arylsulfatase [Cyclobacteriaceae bacterium]